MHDNQLLLASEAARVVGVSVFTLRKLVDSGQIQAQKTPAGHRLVRFSECERYRVAREASHAKQAA